MNRKPEWKFGMVLKRGGQKVMFVMFDKERGRMTGGDWMLAMRMNHGDRMPPQFYKVGDMGNYTIHGWRLDDE